MAHRKGQGDTAHSPRPSVPAPSTPIQPRLRAGKVRSGSVRKDLPVRFGDLVRAARIRCGLSQDQLAARARVHRTHISLVEAGARDPRLTTICALPLGLHLNPGEIMPVLIQPGQAAPEAAPEPPGC